MSQPAETPTTQDPHTRRKDVPRWVGLVVMIAGVVFAVVGIGAYIAVQQTLSDQKITVSDDADMFGGTAVNGPFTAYDYSRCPRRPARSWMYCQATRPERAPRVMAHSRAPRVSSPSSILSAWWRA